MKTSKPIAKPEVIHINQMLYRVTTTEYAQVKESNIAKKALISGALRHAEVSAMKVKMIRCNESETSLIVDGLLVDKDGNPKHDVKEAKKNLIENLEIPFDQDNVPVQPGAWFDTISEAQILAKTINEASDTAAKEIKSLIDKVIEFNAELIEKGCEIG